MVQLKQQKLICQLSPIAYKKIIYHTLRYPSSKVYGVLIGSNPQNITDAFPLFHSPILSPILSVALNLVESNISNQIVAIYQSIDGGHLTQKIIQSNPALKHLIPVRVQVNQNNQIQLGTQKYQIQHIPYENVKADIKNGQHRYIIDLDAHFQNIQLDFRNQYVK